MKHLRDSILESLDTDNLFYKIDKWCNNQKNSEDFISLVQRCKDDKVIDTKKLKQYADDINFDINKFIDFIHDNVDGSQEILDYLYLFKGVIQMILSDRSSNNTMYNTFSGILDNHDYVIPLELKKENIKFVK